MTVQALPDNPDYVFCVEELPGNGMYRIVIAVDDLDKVIPTTLIALTLDNALNLCDGMNRRLGHDRDSWIAFAARVRGTVGPH